MSGSVAARILLIDDNPGDQRLTVEALKEAGFPHRLHIVEDGVQALEFLTQNHNYEAKDVGLIILDLNLPKKDGREVLQELQRDPDLKHIPVVVVSSSDSSEDRSASFALKAMNYYTKPMELAQYYGLIRSLERYLRR